MPRRQKLPAGAETRSCEICGHVTRPLTEAEWRNDRNQHENSVRHLRAVLTPRLHGFDQQQREQRFRELNEKFGIINPKQSTGEISASMSIEEMEEREILKQMLGYS